MKENDPIPWKSFPLEGLEASTHIRVGKHELLLASHALSLEQVCLSGPLFFLIAWLCFLAWIVEIIAPNLPFSMSARLLDLNDNQWLKAFQRF